MRKQDYLVQLIGTLSAAEKRTFKLFANAQSGDKDYLRLFDALENQQVYNTKVLARQLGMNGRQLINNKYYLNQILLRSLDAAWNASADVTVSRTYIEIQIL